MKPIRTQSAAARVPRLPSSCSLAVLAGLGVLTCHPPAMAQGTPLPAGTLPVLRGVVSGQAVVNAPVAGASARLMTVDQNSQRAILDWRSFNIGIDAEVLFRQPGTTASTLNRIYDANPSVIQGKLSSAGPVVDGKATAGGQIILINQNGILFDRGAQINAQSLVASTLNISNSRFNSGALTTGGLSTPAFEGAYDDQGNTVPGSLPPGGIVLGAGNANASVPSLTALPGGSIVLVAPQIENRNALITAPDGQVILAAGGKVYFALPDDGDTVLRGLKVEVEAAGATPVNLSSLIRNLGTISADRGNVTLAALAINQDGRISANTAVQAGGSIYLQARGLATAAAPSRAGTVALGQGSVTQVLPDAADKSTLPESENYATRRGVIVAEGGSIQSQGTLIAPGGRIALNATDAANPAAARIYLGEGSSTSVAGNWADLPLDSNLVSFRVTSNELKDAPDQKSGVLLGATVTVDLRKPNPIFDLSGYLNGKARTASEKSAAGGELTITSTGSVIQRTGATLDASGGGYRYADGSLPTSLLLGADGKIYDIGTAPKDRPYLALLDTYTKTYDRWGQKTVYTGLLYGTGQKDDGYVEGKPGGSIQIKAAAGLVLDGTMKGGVTIGPNQLGKAPRGATLQIGSLNFDGTDFEEGQRIGNVTLGQSVLDTLGSTFSVDTALSQAQKDQVRLAANQLFDGSTVIGNNTLQQTAFGAVEINSNGNIVVPAGVSIEGAAGSSLLLRAPSIDVAGSIDMPAGKIVLQPQTAVETINASQGLGATVRAGASLSARGAWVNTASADGSFVGGVLPVGLLNADGSTSSTLNGGSITVAAPNDSTTRLEGGSVLDVGGGGSIDRNRRLVGGNGGSVSIANAFSTDMTSDWLRSDIKSFALGNGGSLTLGTPRVVIDAADANGVLPSDTTRLLPELFSEHGFANFQIGAGEGIDILRGANVQVSQKNLLVDALAAAGVPTGGDIASVARVDRLPDYLRQPANLSLVTTAAAGQAAALTLDKDASITLDPRGRVTLRASSGMQIDGRIVAPGGNVSLRLAAPGFVETPDLALGTSAQVSVSARFVPQPSDKGLVQGSVIGGGTITLESNNTGIDAAPGSRLDLNGVSQIVDVADITTPSGTSTRQIDGNAGTLLVKSQDTVRLAGTIAATKASASSAGGSFALELTAPGGQLVEPDQRRIVVTQAVTTPTVEAGYVDAPIAIGQLQQAGFDRLRLLSENSIRFDSDATLAFERGVRLDAPLIDVRNDSHVSVSGANVAIGQSLGPRILQGLTYETVPTAATPTIDTRAGGGVLAVQAGSIDVFGSATVNGVSETRLWADGDIQLSGRRIEAAPNGTVGSLTSAGDVALKAAQIYPSTRTDFSIKVVAQPSGAVVPGGTIRVLQSDNRPGDAYSAGGKLILTADSIVQGGTVKAPQGEVNLVAQSRLELAPGSLTSVSADGVTVPLGTTNAGITWTYVDGSGASAELKAPSPVSKGIQLSGRQVDVRPGAAVDISGGGEVQAIEFVPGSGGSTDTLLKPNTYAIIPKSKLNILPVETDIASRQDIGSGLLTGALDTSVYNSLHIGAGSVVPEGEYLLLPARYALLPGAFLVQLQTGSSYSNLKPGQTTSLVNGQTVVAGYRTASGTDVRESTTVGVLVRPGTDAFRESDYTLSDSRFFADVATRDRKAVPRLPIDAGRLSIADATALSLGGEFRTDAGQVTAATGVTTGRAAVIDLSAERIAVVDTIGQAGVDPGYLQVNAAGLTSLGGSVLIGGTRSDNADGSTQLNTVASKVLVANQAGSELKAPELLITASDDIEVLGGSVITAAGGPSGGAAPVYRTQAGGALVRLSSGAQGAVDRGTSVDRTTGTVSIAQGATLQADGSMLLDGTRSTQSQGSLLVGRETTVDNELKRVGGSLSLASSQVSLGQIESVPGLDGGLALSNAKLLALTAADSVVIKGYDGIDLFGSAVLGGSALGSLTLDTNALRGRVVAGAGAAASTIAAQEVRLVNTGSTAPTLSPDAGGSLTVSASRLVMGQGNKTLTGFSSVTTAATGEILGEGEGSLQVASDWTVNAPQVGVAAGARQSWQAVDTRSGTAAFKALALGNPKGGGAPVAGSEAAGGRLQLAGRSVEVTTAIEARSGQISIEAIGDAVAGDITLGAGAVLDVRGVAKSYNGTLAVASAGSLNLQSGAGAVTIAEGATVDARGVGGGDAGTVRIAARSLSIDGAISASAEAGGRGGQFALDVGSLPGFSVLNTRLNSGGFSESRDIRVRTGDLHVQSTDVVAARNISLSADRGRIDIDGTLNARTAAGGAGIDVWAATGLALTGARVWADGTGSGASAQSPVSDGGQVRLGTNSGQLSFDAASEIDVRPGTKGKTGTVTLTVARDDANVVAPVQLFGTVLGVRDGNGSAASVSLQAQRTYAAADNVSAADIAGYAADHAAFVGAVDPAALLGGLKGDVKASVHGATELRAAGNLTLSQPWDLTTSEWLATSGSGSATVGQAGTLTLRAAGDLTVSRALGMPNDNLLAGETWNLRLVGGADLAAANPMATQHSLTKQALESGTAPAAGSVTISSDSGKVRTGTGSIEIAAAADFRMDALRSVVYTAGRIGAADSDPNGNNRWAQEGGSIHVAVGRDAVGNSNQWITEWLRRPRTSGNTAANPDWWAYRANFQQGVGTLGGGDIWLTAGRDVKGLSAMLPTSGRNVVQSGLPVLDVQGGGDLTVTAGNNIEGGAYLVGRGSGDLLAGGTVGAGARMQLYLQGTSSGDVPDEATVHVEAGGAVSLQSVNDPTAIFMNNSRAEDRAAAGALPNCLNCGPSFAGTGSNVRSFFTYSSNSAVELTAKSGDIALGSQLAPGRTLVASQVIPTQEFFTAGAYPASLRAAAFEGDITNVNTSGIVSFPSSSAQVALLAQGSLHDLQFTSSDRLPSAVPSAKQRPSNSRSLSGSTLVASGNESRLVSRDGREGYAFDLQALTGNVDSTTANSVNLSLPGVSRVSAGQDIVNVTLVLENLTETDVSVVRAESGDVRPSGIEIKGPGSLLVQAGRNIDLGAANIVRGSSSLGGVISTGRIFNPSLSSDDGAQLLLVAGVTGTLDLAKLTATYGKITGISASNSDVFKLLRLLDSDPQQSRILAASGLNELAAVDASYAPYADLGAKYPQLLASYQDAARTVGGAKALPVGDAAAETQVNALYALLNTETNRQAILAAASVADLVSGTKGGSDYLAYADLDRNYPRVLDEYQLRLSNGVPLPLALDPIRVIYADVFKRVIEEAIPSTSVAKGDLNSYLTSIQSYSGSDIQLWAPNGTMVVGLTTPAVGKTIGVLTNAGGGIRAVVGGNFSINQGKVLTAQGGDIQILSTNGNIDAGRGALTSLSTPPPTRTPILIAPDGATEPIVIGYTYTLPASASGSGIQTLTSDPDGLGPLRAPSPGSTALITPAGVVDAGEAGIRSGGAIFVDAQAVLNASNISAGGPSVGVPVATSGSLASSVATSGASAAGNSKAGDDAAAASANAAKAAAAAAQLAKPNILTVEVLGFGDRNCKEQDKDCFAK